MEWEWDGGNEALQFHIAAWRCFMSQFVMALRRSWIKMHVVVDRAARAARARATLVSIACVCCLALAAVV